MTNLTCNSLLLFIWLKDESINISNYQDYPSSTDAQSYLPMGFKDQQSALAELEDSGYIQLDKSGCQWRYRIIETAESTLKANLDIYSQDQNALPYSQEEDLLVANS